jgi:hypothetical protein
MPCFCISVLCPISNNSTVNSLNNLYFEKHVREHGGNINFLNMEGTHFIYEVSICDEDAVGFLRYLTKPFVVAYILIARTNTLFYKNSRIQLPHVAPLRKDKLLKDIYWYAVQCESNIKRQ